MVIYQGQHLLRWWLVAIKQQAITWVNVDQDLCHHMASLGHKELISGDEPTKIVANVITFEM